VFGTASLYLIVNSNEMYLHETCILKLRGWLKTLDTWLTDLGTMLSGNPELSNLI
jgi:hypothetical protein